MKRIQHGHRSGGFSLFEAIIVSVVLVVLIAVFLLALRPRPRGGHISCSNNLKQIGLAFRQWAMDNNGKYPMQVSANDGGTMELVETGLVYPHFQVLSNELNTPAVLVCTEDRNWKRPGSNFTFTGYFPGNFQVSYFIGVDANPSQRAMFLSGDANLAVGGKPVKSGLLSLWTNTPVAWAKPLRPYHDEGGNILLVDLSVEQGRNARLRELLTEIGVATNRLAIP